MRVLLLLAILAHTSEAAPLPMRPLPKPSMRPMAAGPARWVAVTGSDTNDGSKDRPWKTIAVALKTAKPGDTIYLRGGVYHEPIAITRGGTAGMPVTIRSAPNELAIIDAGIREFLDSPKNAWEPVIGARGEYRSSATYPTLPLAPAVRVTGNFADTMIPLHGYRFVEDLRATNIYWNVKNQDPGTGVYLGPGVWLDPATRRIHARLSAIGLKSYPDYAGPDDPRKLPLVIGTDRSALRIENAQHVRVQDLVFRGSTAQTVHIDHASDLEFDGVAIYGGAPALFTRSVSRFKLVRSALRGSAAPWSSRPSMKYRGDSPYLLVAAATAPQSTDWELAQCDFTDGHDGLIIDSLKRLRFHHNRISNFNDDALYLTYVPRDTIGDDIQIYENEFTQIFTVLAFGDTGNKTQNAIGKGIYVFRNLFDLRRLPHRALPRDAAEDAAPITAGWEGRMCGDHGSPIWDPVFFYQNTVLTDGKPWRNYYGAVLVQNVQNTKRRVFNNIFIRMDGPPGLGFQRPTDDLQVDGNLLWGVANGPSADFFTKFRRSKMFVQSQATYAAGFGAHDVYADPQLRSLGSGPLDIRLQPKSPAIDAGVPLPASWPDSLRNRDTGKPDIGALPGGATMATVGAP
jgi:hypothetical protein